MTSWKAISEMATDADIIADGKALDSIALMLRVVNETNSILSGKGIDLLTDIVETTGRKAR